jgi:hypothetical protein
MAVTALRTALLRPLSCGHRILLIRRKLRGTGKTVSNIANSFSENVAVLEALQLLPVSSGAASEASLGSEHAHREGVLVSEQILAKNLQENEPDSGKLEVRSLA